MPETKESQAPRPDESLTTDEYAPRQYSFRSSAMTTLKALLIGGGAVGALWLVDALVAK